MAMEPAGSWAQAQLISGFINASVKHHTRSTFVSLFEGAHGNAATSTKLSHCTVQSLRIASETRDKEGQVCWLLKATGVYESIRQTIAPYLLYETSKATVTRQMDSTCRHSKSRNLALFVWCILKEMESH